MRFLKCAVLPAFAGWGTALLFLFASSLFLLRSDDPAEAMRILPVLACVTGALVCGLLIAVLDKEGRGEYALLGGVMMVMLHLICSLLPGGEKGPAMALALGIGQPAICIFTYFLCKKRANNGRKKVHKSVKKRHKSR